MARRFHRDPGFERALLASAPIRDLLVDRTAAAAARASDLAPDDPNTGGADLHSSIVADVELGPDGYTGRVTALNFKAPWFEEGATGVPARPFLRPAVEQEVGPIERGR